MFYGSSVCLCANPVWSSDDTYYFVFIEQWVVHPCSVEVVGEITILLFLFFFFKALQKLLFSLAEIF